jgi:magnesium transporter
MTEEISVITFDHSSAQMRHLSSVDELFSSVNDSTIQWINIENLKDNESVKKIEKIYNIHPLTIEDVLDTRKQPKVETFENYRYISLKSIRRKRNSI